jgi:methylisocitrate lyase
MHEAKTTFTKGGRMSKAKQLRGLLANPGILVLPGAYDVLSAHIAAQCGFEVVFTSGFGLAASALGLPDLGLMTMTESLDRVRHMARAVDVPVVADMDTGYGNPLNVIRTVEECLGLGVAGIILEDQEWPKKCGHMEGKRVIPLEDHVQKLKAAIHARGKDDLILIARTDAREPLGLDEAIRRGRAFRDAGADVIFIEAPRSVEELEQIARAIPDALLFANMIEGGKTPFLSAKELEQLGYKMVVYPLSALFSAAKATLETLRTLREKGTTSGAPALLSFKEFEKVIGLARYRELERRFVS